MASGTATSHPVATVPLHPIPAKHKTKGLRPFVRAFTAFGRGHGFAHTTSNFLQRRFREIRLTEGLSGAPLKSVYAGISTVLSDSGSAMVAFAIHDGTYLLDFAVKHLTWDSEHSAPLVIADFVVSELAKYEREHLSKFIGGGLPQRLIDLSPALCSRLWAELDIVPITPGTHRARESDALHGQTYFDCKSVEEQADSLARKCIMYFGPTQLPLLQVGYRGIVQVDAGYHAHLATIDDFKSTVGAGTWNSIMKYAADLKERKVKIAFFSSTPQGGGVALMRHALVRFSKVLGLDLKWYVPKPKPGIFRITKTNHNILQGVAGAEVWSSTEEKGAIDDWIRENAERDWLSKGGPLTPPTEGGADVIFVDDPQMPGLIPLIKAITPNRPVVYRSHIELRSDLISKDGNPQSDVWKYLWDRIKLADIFISHPIGYFVPKNVPTSMVGYMPAASDWLDGLNKTLSDWDLGYYGHIFNKQCQDLRMVNLKFSPAGYIVQIARFDPSKGIPDVIASYDRFRDKLRKSSRVETPQLLICGHGSVDDPDGSMIYDQTMELLETKYSEVASDVLVMRIGPSDQLLNTLLSKSRVALQLSVREGFEIKVSEALRKGKPVIATRAGGIPLQVQHGKNGFLVDIGDTEAVSQHLYDLWTDQMLYKRMSEYALRSVSDEVSTVGNTLSWLYLASKMSTGEEVKPSGRWVNDMARDEAGEPYRPGENRLPRFG